MSERHSTPAASAMPDEKEQEIAHKVEQTQELKSPSPQLRGWREQILQSLLIVTLVVGGAAVLFELFLVIPEQRWDLLVLLVLAYGLAIAITTARRLPFRVRALAFLLLFYALGTLDLSQSGLTGDGRVFLLTFPVLAFVLLGQRAGTWALIISLATLVVTALLMVTGILVPAFEASSLEPRPWLTGIFIYALLALIVLIPVSYVVNNLVNNLDYALQEAHRRWKEVRELSSSLEQRVDEQTRNLARRSKKLEASAQVAREAAAIRDVRRLLEVTVRLISEQFGFYHAGIFLLDEKRAYAILRAASSSGGQRMLGRGHRLQVGAVGIVGFVAASGEPRIALDTDQDTIFFDNPDLPHTRSEMALPLHVRGQVIGVLDVQSTHEGAFSEEDIAILQTMADQVALAIENARLLEESQRALQELQIAHGEYIRSAWENLETMPAFVYDQIEVTQAGTEFTPLVEEAVSIGDAITQRGTDGQSTLAIPLRLHGQVIGAIGLESTGRDRKWTEEEIQLLETVSDQVALALQSARFYEMEQQRRHVADTLRDTARVVGSTLDPQEVIERLLDQLAGLIDFSTASIQIIENGQRRLLGGRGFDYEEAREHQALQRPLDEDPLIQEVVQSRRAFVIPDTHNDSRWEQMPDTAHVRSWIAAPMMVGQEVIGLLTVDHNRPNAYNVESAELVSAIAAQAAIAVQNARLFEQTARRAEYERMVSEITGRLRASTNLKTIVETAARELGQTLGSSRVLVRVGLDEKGLQAAQRAASKDSSREEK